MAEETKDKIVLPEYKVVRNEVEVGLTTFEITKGSKVGKAFAAPKFALETITDAIKWFGESNLLNVMNKYAKSKFQSIWFNSFDADGSFNEPKFLADAVEFTSSGMLLEEIDNLIDEVTGEQQLLIRTAPINDQYEFIHLEDRMKIRELASKLTALRAQRDDRSKKGKKEDKEEPSAPLPTVSPVVPV